MATAGLSLKLVVEASRGAVIAVHAAGGLARGHVQALRLLRAAEGLCRGAVAVLQADGSKCEKTKGVGKDKDKKDTGKGKGKGKDSDVGMGVAPKEPGAQPRRRRRGRAPAAAAAPVAVPEFDDSWADGVHVAPPVPAQPLDDAAARGRRPLVARHSGSRSPRRLSPMPASVAPVAAAAAHGLPLALLAGRIATIKGLVSRPKLENVLVALDVQDMESGRWICHIKGGEKLRILPEKLVPIAEDGQKFSRLRYDNS
jgi:hypothetical protein